MLAENPAQQQKIHRMKNTEMKQVSQAEREQFFDFWSKQRQAIQGHVSEKTMEWFNIYTAHNNVGCEFGQLRPGKLGQWDLFWWLTGPQSQNICGEAEAMLVAGLTAAEVAEEKRREHYRENYVDPDDQFAIAQFERTKRMSPSELDAEILRLEQRLEPEPLPS